MAVGLGRPFHLRGDVLVLRRETEEIAQEAVRNAPAQVRAEPRTVPLEKMLAESLRVL